MKRTSKRMFISENGVKFEESKLLKESPFSIATKLGLGSGHEMAKLDKIDDSRYIVTTLPYFGHLGQREFLTLVKKK